MQPGCRETLRGDRGIREVLPTTDTCRSVATKIGPIERVKQIIY